ncbi:MAG: tetratricopeptide repeat protein, partial [Candidatus Eisenbacteria bacterium]|nr:tetratricopeptide repeat protein [Candidatus Eisenbacteria bacterium]
MEDSERRRWYLPFRRVVLAFSILLCAAAAPAQQTSTADSLQSRIELLRATGDYAAALECARKWCAALSTESTAKAWQRRTAAVTCSTLERVARWDAADRRRLAEADSLETVLRDLWSQGDYDAGAEAARRQLEIRRRLLGGAHPEVARSLGNLALFRFDQGDHDAAEALYGEALTMRETLLGPHHPEVASSLSDLGWLAFIRADYDEAERLHREALA